MKNLIITVMMLVLSAALLLPVAGCDGETGETEPATSENNQWLKYLSILPENEVTLNAACIQTSDYADILRKAIPEEIQEQPTAVTIDVMAHINLPLFLRYSGEEWKNTLGFTIDEVTASIYASAGPPKEYQTVYGTFTAEDIETAAKTGPLQEHLEIKSHAGYEYYSWGEDMGIHMTPEWRSNIRNLGRGHRLAYVGGFALWMIWTEGLTDMIDAYAGNIPSLADNEEYKLLAVELEKLDTVTAFFSSATASISEFKEMYHDNLEELRQKGDMEQVEAFENEPLLKPFLSFATGAGEDEQGAYMVIILLNPDESTAKENAGLLERRISESIMNPYTTNPEMNLIKWTDNDAIESMEINGSGKFTIAKLYGKVFSRWDDFNLFGATGMFHPLLLHE